MIYFKSLYSKNFYYYRYDPVPGVHKYPKGHYYRRIRTTQERRWSCFDHEYFRMKRNHKNIPNSWDDIQRHFQRNWKKFRKTQYKAKD